MNAKDIEHYLSLLGNALADLGVTYPVRVLLLGGAFMLTQISVRRTTEDIDVLPLDDGAPADPTSIPLAVALWQAAHTVARERQLDPQWFNTVIADFVRTAGTIPTGTLWRKHGPLEIYIPPKEYILVLKLLANRKKDWGDIAALRQVLNIGTREQAQQLIDRYIPDKDVQYFCALHLTLAMHFPTS